MSTSANLHQLLITSAIVQQFDIPLLCVIADIDPDSLDHLSIHEYWEPIAEQPEHYLLPDTQRTLLLTQLRNEQPAEETRLHWRAFQISQQRLQHQPPESRNPADEDRCLYHLDALFILLGRDAKWQELIDACQQIRALNPTQRRHHQRLTMIHGYCLIHLKQFDQGEAELATLLLETIDDADVHIKTVKGLADSAIYRGRHEQALEQYQHLYDLAETHQNSSYQGIALLNTGLVFNELDQNETAFDYCQRSLPYFQAAADRQREGAALYHLGLYAMYLARWEDARHYTTQAAAIYQQLGSELFIGHIAWVQAVIAHFFGAEDEAEQLYQQALTIAEHPDHQHVTLAIDALVYLGLLYQTQENYDASLTCYRRALEIADRIDQQHRASLLLFRIGELYRAANSLEAAYQTFDQAITIAENLRSNLRSEDIKIGMLGTTAQLYEAMVLLCLRLQRWEAAFNYVERARSQALLDRLRQSNDAQLRWDLTTATLAEVQASLPSDALLLEFFTTGVEPANDPRLKTLPSDNIGLRAVLLQPARTIIFAVTHDQIDVSFAPLDPNKIQTPSDVRLPGRHLLHGRLPEHLYRCLISPVARQVQNCRTLYLAPHGPLHHIPFTALRANGSPPLLHAHGPALAHIPSATVLLRTGLQQPRRTINHVISFGCNHPPHETPLRFAEAEAIHIANYWQGTSYIGTAATADQLIQASPHADLIHIAGHARFEANDPLASGLCLADPQPLTAREMVEKLQLQAELIVLSSCTSGTNRIVAGDELLGLQRALLLAGTPTVICTRWEANDLAALLLMDHLHQQLNHGATPTDALRHAQLWLQQLTIEQIEQWTSQTLTQHPESSVLRETLMQLIQQPSQSQPFADPVYWATFMVVGRG